MAILQKKLRQYNKAGSKPQAATLPERMPGRNAGKDWPGAQGVEGFAFESTKVASSFCHLLPENKFPSAKRKKPEGGCPAIG
ncbi:MAG: hypothetical protein ONB48_08930 [candidate division KSB1 bacterium]|nr:hypothetical protein [candidate division KSB1 bacterium]MDZ7275948.1 hypothetical protein [candidate division KSB1 bacterium]MDZ7285770.1 hypothetical protein [candidate division KSB1 bacterium]MDZ7298802.1 hypothetical protein [candidate division KSB1 bacterium]MDZ7308852.1 hypothetical protein [candidate division KSB1 bacterium]